MTPSRRPVVRVQTPTAIVAGTVIPVRVAISHPMVSGQQPDERGRRQPRDILTRFECHGPEGLLIGMDLQPALAANPSVQFWLRPQHSMTLQLRWWGDHGFEHRHEHALVVV